MTALLAEDLQEDQDDGGGLHEDGEKRQDEQAEATLLDQVAAAGPDELCARRREKQREVSKSGKEG